MNKTSVALIAAIASCGAFAKTIDLNGKWNFSKDGAPATIVRVPHDWSIGADEVPYRRRQCRRDEDGECEKARDGSHRRGEAARIARFCGRFGSRPGGRPRARNEAHVAGAGRAFLTRGFTEVKTTWRGTLCPPREAPTMYLGRYPMPTSRASDICFGR